MTAVKSVFRDMIAARIIRMVQDNFIPATYAGIYTACRRPGIPGTNIARRRHAIGCEEFAQRVVGQQPQIRSRRTTCVGSVPATVRGTGNAGGSPGNRFRTPQCRRKVRQHETHGIQIGCDLFRSDHLALQYAFARHIDIIGALPLT